MLPLQSERLTVREFTLDELAEIYADPRVRWWEPAPFTRDQTRDAIARNIELYERDGMGEYAVVLRTDERLIGVCGPVFRDIEGELLPELGWELRPDQWGHGYATEAARAALTRTRELGLHTIYSLIVPDNVRSQGVARRLGMTIERQVVWSARRHDLWARELP